MNKSHLPLILGLIIYYLFGEAEGDAANEQLSRWKEENPIIQKATNQRGILVPSLTASRTVGKRGPMVLDDRNFIELLAHFERERIPERVVHAKGNCAYGEFIVLNHNIGHYCKADFLSEYGKKTPLFVRFSTVAGGSSSQDTVSSGRGFAIKFYTKEGNYDLVGNNLGNFQIKDGILFPALSHSRKKNPVTNLDDKTMFWNFAHLRPECVLNTLFQFAGKPDGYRKMDGFGVHTFRLVNATGHVHFARFTWISDQGKHYMDWVNATRVAGTDPDYAGRDLYNAIAEGNYPSWKFYMQLVPEYDVYEFPDIIFDSTKVLNVTRYPLTLLGKFVLNSNPSNFFEECEQVAMDPGNFVPGIEASVDRLLQARMFSYGDAQRYRLGTNYLQLNINKPHNKVFTYERAGTCDHGNNNGAPNYFPNSYNGPDVDPRGEETNFYVEERIVLRYDNGHEDFLNSREYYESLTTAEKHTVAKNLASSISEAEQSVQIKVLHMYKQVSLQLYADLSAELAKLDPNPTPPYPHPHPIYPYYPDPNYPHHPAPNPYYPDTVDPYNADSVDPYYPEPNYPHHPAPNPYYPDPVDPYYPDPVDPYYPEPNHPHHPAPNPYYPVPDPIDFYSPESDTYKK